MNKNKLIEESMRGDDLVDLLDHIAWDQTVKPALEKYKTNYHNLLVKSVLGQAVVDQTTGQVISKEMLAGRIEGIDWLNKFILHIITRSELAKSNLEDLQVQQ